MLKYIKDAKYKKYGKITAAALRKNNIIYLGKNHSECFRQKPLGYLRDAEQGFWTENGIFVDRKLGLKIAKYYNQIIEKHPPKDELFSEDLWY